VPLQHALIAFAHHEVNGRPGILAGQLFDQPGRQDHVADEGSLDEEELGHNGRNPPRSYLFYERRPDTYQ
jgi:hypothetical protein